MPTAESVINFELQDLPNDAREWASRVLTLAIGPNGPLPFFVYAEDRNERIVAMWRFGGVKIKAELLPASRFMSFEYSREQKFSTNIETDFAEELCGLLKEAR